MTKQKLLHILASFKDIFSRHIPLSPMHAVFHQLQRQFPH